MDAFEIWDKLIQAETSDLHVVTVLTIAFLQLVAGY